jgi:hypothetical protein
MLQLGQSWYLLRTWNQSRHHQFGNEFSHFCPVDVISCSSTKCCDVTGLTNLIPNHSNLESGTSNLEPDC